MLYHILVPHSFLLLNNIQFYSYSTLCLSICQLVDILVVSTLGLLWITLQLICIYNFLCEYTFSIFLGIGVDLLGYDSSVLSILRNCQIVLLSTLPFYIPASNVSFSNSSFSTPFLTLVTVCLFDFSHPSGCEVVSHCDFHFPERLIMLKFFFHVLIGHM